MINDKLFHFLRRVKLRILKILEIRHTFIMALKSKTPIVIVMVDGGLASQLLKYLLGSYLEDRLKVKVKYDLSYYKNNPRTIDGKHVNDFKLTEVFPEINFPVSSMSENIYYRKKYRFLNQKPFIFNEEIFTIKPPLYVDGYYMHWKYINLNHVSKLIPRVELKGQNLDTIEAIQDSSCSVAVHVRRGDYVGSVHDVLDAQYFINAINLLQKLLKEQDPTFFIFSNGMEWVEINILSKCSKDIKIRLVKGNDHYSGIYDFTLISQCNHQICSNSGFSFLAALINKNPKKQVIIPEIWMDNRSGQYENHDYSMRYPGWTVLSNEGSVCS